MGYEKILERLDKPSLITLLVFIAALILPGLGFIFIADRELFESLSLAKLILLSSTIGFPVIAINAFSSITITLEEEITEYKLHWIAGEASISAATTIYCALIFKLLLNWNSVLLLIVLLVSEILYIGFRRFRFKQNNKANKSDKSVSGSE